MKVCFIIFLLSKNNLFLVLIYFIVVKYITVLVTSWH